MAEAKSNILDRPLPYSLEAEQNVLGSILLLPQVIDDVVTVLRQDDFYDESNKILFEQLVDMHTVGHKIDLLLLRERLVTLALYDKVGGAQYLAKIVHSVATAAHAIHYAEIVQQKATFRNLITAATDIIRNAIDGEGEAREILSQAEQKIFSILDTRGANTLISAKDLLREAMDRIDARMKGEVTEGCVDSGFTDLDQMTGGLHASELIILAARPSMGKTAFAMNIAEHVSFQAGQPVLFVSLEMSGVELIERMLCSVARVNGHQLRNGTISKDDRKRLVKVAGELSKAPFFVDDSPGRTVTEIAAAARRIKRREGRLGLIVIDYLQLIEPDNSKDPRQEQVAKIARRLKGLSREIKVPVLCLAQLNRQAEDGKDHRPRMSHLRESGAIEQDADVVMFVHREEYYRRGEDQKEVAGQAQIFIEKQRNGPTGDIELVWRKEFTRFESKAVDRIEEFDSFNAG